MQSDLYMQLVELNKVQLIKLQQHKLFVTSKCIQISMVMQKMSNFNMFGLSLLWSHSNIYFFFGYGPQAEPCTPLTFNAYV